MLSTIMGLILGVVGGGTIVYAQEEEPPIPKTVLIEVRYEEERIKELIRKTFPEDPDTMIAIAECESQFRNVPSQTGDYGVFQINQVHLETLSELGLDREIVEDNIKFARILYDESGTQPWYMSEHCWK